MSLVNEALKKARLEAARKDAANRGVPYPILGSGRHSSSRPWILALVATVLFAGIAGFLLYRAGAKAASGIQSAERVDEILAANTRESSTPIEIQEPRSEPADSLFEETPEPPRETPRRFSPAHEPAAEAAPGREPESADPAPVPQAVEPTPRPSEAIASRNAPHEPETIPADDEAPAAQPVPTVEAAVEPVPTREAETGQSEQEFIRRADLAGVGPVELGGIAWSGDRPFALLNGRVVRPGDSVAGLVVDEIQPNTVRLSSAAGTLVLKLK